MSDLDGLHGVYPAAFRWSAEEGFLGISAFNPQSGEREVRPIEFGQPATFAADLATRMRGYGLVRPGQYEMLLTPVGAPPPPWPGNDEFKPAIGMWLFSPTHGPVRLETCGTILRNAVVDIWDRCRREPSAVEGLQPVISFVDRVPVLIKALKKTFYAPVIERVGWVERDAVPGWMDRAPTVLPPAALPVLGPPAAAAPAKEPIKASRHHKAVRPATKPSGDLPPFNDDIPWK
jgi:hypothetical protein